MKTIFLDSNIYLEFYNVQSKAIRKLIPSVAALADNIFVTKQIVDEVNRNKLSQAQRLFADLRKRLETDLSLPDFITEALQTKRRAKKGWGAPSKETMAAIEEAISTQLRKIMESRDMVSVGLAPVFAKAVAPAPEELSAAKRRKERGNPPGKSDDPLGDQLNWEQLLANVQKDDEVWIVAKDSDYVLRDRDVCFLHSLLFDDLRQRKIQPQNIHVFDRLTTALKDFDKKSGIRVKKLPSAKVLIDAAVEEVAQGPAAAFSSVERKHLEKAIEALPPKERIAFVLHDIEGYSVDEIAEMMGMKEKEVLTTHARSHRKLMKLLSK